MKYLHWLLYHMLVGFPPSMVVKIAKTLLACRIDSTMVRYMAGLQLTTPDVILQEAVREDFGGSNDY